MTLQWARSRKAGCLTYKVAWHSICCHVSSCSLTPSSEVWDLSASCYVWFAAVRPLITFALGLALSPRGGLPARSALLAHTTVEAKFVSRENEALATYMEE